MASPSVQFPSEISQINLAYHCPFCLKKLTSENGAKLVNSGNGSSKFNSLSFLWPYLRFGERTLFREVSYFQVPKFSFLETEIKCFQSKASELATSSAPPMCEKCFEEVKILKSAHDDFIKARKALREQVKRVRRNILTTKSLQNVSRRNKFVEELRSNPSISDESRRNTLTFLDFITVGVGNNNDEESLTSIGPVYPLTSCELLLPVDSPHLPEEEEDDLYENVSLQLDTADVKIEQPSDEENESNYGQMLVDDTKETLLSHSSSEKVDDEGELPNSPMSNEFSIEENEDDDPEYMLDEKEIDVATESENSDFREMYDPLSDPRSSNSNSSSFKRKKVSENSIETSGLKPILDVGAKRGRGRPRKHPPRETTCTSIKKTAVEKALNLPKSPTLIDLESEAIKLSRRIYPCEICASDPPIIFNSEIGLGRHKVDEHGANPLKCKTCLDLFYTQLSLFKHETKDHPQVIPDKPKFFCDLCGKSFSSRFYVGHHKKVVHLNEKPFSCESCGKTFTSKLGRDLHIKAFHLGEKFNCSECGKIFKFQHLLERHQDSQHPNSPEALKRQQAKEERLSGDAPTVKRGRLPKWSTIEKTKADKDVETLKNADSVKFSSESSAEAPTLKLPGRGKGVRTILYNCELCIDSEPFFTETSLLVHKQSKHGESLEKNIKCKTCFKSFLTPRALQHHERTMHPHVKPDPVKIPCDQCNKTFAAKFSLRIHQRIVHQKEKLYECVECQKTFQNSMGLRFHIEAIHKGQRYKCDMCRKEFKYSSAIKRHKMAAHNVDISESKKGKVKPKYPCTICEPSENAPVFLSEASLQNHLITHHGADPFYCLSCDEKFLWRKALLNHIKKVHEKSNDEDVEEETKKKEKPVYTCDHCGKLYLNRDNLKKHLTKQHDPDWPKKAQQYKCEICGKTYINKEGYKSHMKMQHRYKTEHICHICGQSFRNPQYLNNHMRNHTNMRNHHCPQCPARFKRKDTCDKHIKFVHNRVKQRNVGIRRMHFRPYVDEEDSTSLKRPANLNLSSNNPSTTTSQTHQIIPSSNEFSALAVQPQSDSGLPFSEAVKSGKERQQLQNTGEMDATTFATESYSNNTCGFGQSFMNLQ